MNGSTTLGPRCACCGLWSARLKGGVAVNAAPQVPTGDAGIGPPFAGDFLDLFWLRRLPQAIGAVDGVANTEVAGRQDIGAAEGEDQEHVGGPDADALHLSEVLDDSGVVKSWQILKPYLSGARLFSEVEHVFRLLPGEAERTKFLGRLRGEPFRRDVAYGLDDSGVDRRSGFAAELLVDDGTNEGFEGGLAVLNSARTDTVDDGG